MKVHPAADVFPMMSDGELAELAADIKVNGLIYPIILDPTGELLVDGRNRQLACEKAGVEPRYERLNGQDPRDYIISANINRRHLTAGQRAIAQAMIYPDPAKRGGKKDRGSMFGKETLVSRSQLSEAREIVPYADLAQRVMAGTLKFDPALAEARARTEAKANEQQYLAELQREAPDLAEQVSDEKLTVSEAWAAYKQRLNDAMLAERNKRATLLRVTESLYRGAAAFAVDTFVESIRERLTDPEFCTSLIEQLRIDDTDPDLVRGAQALVNILREIKEHGYI